jgi:hypothetical protein
VVTDATATTTPKATANKTSAVRCSFMGNGSEGSSSVDNFYTRSRVERYCR